MRSITKSGGHEQRQLQNGEILKERRSYEKANCENASGSQFERPQCPRGGGPGGFGLEILRSVTLTADQQTQVTQILQNNKSASQAAGQQLFLARCAYSE